MKRLFFLIIIIGSLLAVTNAQAQLLRFGVKGGATFSKFDWNHPIDNNTIAGYQAGIMARVKIPLIGIAVQPELLYSRVGNDFGKLGYLQVPVNLQWGVDLKVVRPFFQAGPYWGYAIDKSGDGDGDGFKLDNINRSDWGIGVGAGIDIINHIHVAFKYDWGFTNLVKNDAGVWTGSVKNRAFNLSIGYFF